MAPFQYSRPCTQWHPVISYLSISLHTIMLGYHTLAPHNDALLSHDYTWRTRDKSSGVIVSVPQNNQWYSSPFTAIETTCKGSYWTLLTAEVNDKCTQYYGDRCRSMNIVINWTNSFSANCNMSLEHFSYLCMSLFFFADLVLWMLLINYHRFVHFSLFFKSKIFFVSTRWRSLLVRW